MTPEPKEIGHQVKFSNSLIGLFKRGCWEIPEIMGSSFMGLVGVGLGLLGVYRYYKNNGDNREFKQVFCVVRSTDPRAAKIINPVHTEFKCLQQLQKEIYTLSLRGYCCNCSEMGSRFQVVEQGPPIEVFLLNKLFSDDKFENKVNLGVGAYRDENGKPWVLPVVRKMEQKMAQDPSILHEYLPVLGMEQFSAASVSMLLGEDSPAIAEGRAFGVQTLSGTGGLRVGAELLNKHLKYDTFYYSNPTWENHHLVFVNSGFTQPRTYRYWDAKKRAIDFDGLIEDLKNAPENAVIILHACAHNPTGIDPTQDQWEKIADVMEERKLFPFFDSAYQGFASGDLDRDAWAVRYFAKRGFELVCAQSYAKNFGLYNERVGNLTLVMSDKAHVAPTRSQLTWIVRGMYSNPPAHGARVVANVLADKQLFDEWRDHIKMMSSRVIQMREALRSELVKLGTPGNWDHIVKQIGLFSYTGLTARQSEHLIKEFHIYLLKSGRINICGLNPGNVQYVAKAINDAIAKFPDDDKCQSKI